MRSTDLSNNIQGAAGITLVFIYPGRKGKRMKRGEREEKTKLKWGKRIT
jgi:hypothetical protein